MKKNFTFLINSVLNFIGFKAIKTNKLVNGKRIVQYKIVKNSKWEAPKHVYNLSEFPITTLNCIKSNTMLGEIRLKNIIETSQYVLKNNIKGDFIECGVWKGGAVALMAYILKAENQNRKLQLFDAFDDICEPDANVDGERAINEVGGRDYANGRITPISGIYNIKGGSGNEQLVMSLITNDIGYDRNLVYLHKGWFQDTLPLVKNNIAEIALLRLDGDWYASTKVCLESLYDKVVNGGIVIIDDYGAYDGCKKAVDDFLNQKRIKADIIWVDNECIFWIKKS